GLNLNAGEQLVIRDYDGNPSLNPAGPPIAIQVDQHFEMASGGTLRFVFETDAWDSTISFAPGIPVSLGGSLELTFADGVDAAGQIGRTFDLFDWTGVAPTGTFNVAGPYTWNLSQLYTTGEVTLLLIGSTSGDFDADGDVDGADFVAWQTHFPTPSGATPADGDADADGDVDEADFVRWQTNFPSAPSPSAAPVPEPATWLLALGAILPSCFRRHLFPRCVRLRPQASDAHAAQAVCDHRPH
ncbi:MAG: hypothetical protein IT427_13040, partial [Pirellulales bacterium]|nr:hypothetical protein [Pirellulales bacterium]